MGMIKQVDMQTQTKPIQPHISQINLLTSAIKQTKILPSPSYCMLERGTEKGKILERFANLPKGIFFWHKK